MNTAPHPSNDTAADLFARRVAARMTQSKNLPYDISERLRAARMQALAKRKVVAPVRKAAPVVLHWGSKAILGRGGDGGWWNALVLGHPPHGTGDWTIRLVNAAQDENGLNEVAEVDAALLTDDLPPEAYADPGFMQFLKTAAARN